MKKRVGFFGTGLMSTIYAQILRQRPDVDLVGVVGNTPEKTATFASQFNIPGYSGSRYDDLFKASGPLDAVLITTPEWVRAEPLRAAIGNAKAILLEKPFAGSWEEAQKCQALLAPSHTLLRLCHVLRYSPRFFAMREAVKRGDIGEVRHLFARRNSNHHRVLRVLGKTDLCFWLAPHDIDIMRWITGSEVESVYATSRAKLKEADDYLIAHLRFQNGVNAVLESSWCGPPVSAASRDAVFEVRGTQGNIEVDDHEMNVRVFTKEAKVSAPDTYEDFQVQGIRAGFFKNMLDAFLRDMDDPSGSKEALVDGFETARVCSMLRRALDTGRIVTRSEFS